MPPRIGWVTCLNLPEPDHDEAISITAFREAGHQTEAIAWDDPDVDWSTWDAVILRATWDYPFRVEEFKTWLSLAANQTRVINPPSLVVGNLHKGYLLDLRATGIPIVPTKFVLSGSTDSLAENLAELNCDKFVIKPAVGAGSYKTKVFDLTSLGAAEAFIAQ